MLAALAGIGALAGIAAGLATYDAPMTPQLGVAPSTEPTAAFFVVFAVLRAAALVAAVYLLVMTLLTLVARVVRSELLGRIAAALTLRAARPLVHAVVGVGVVATAVPAPASALPAVVAVVPAAHAEDVLPPPPLVEARRPGAPGGPVNARSRRRRAAAVWTVAPGDHFWSIAEQVVARDVGDSTTADVARYWRRLIRANRSRLVDPGNPDLLHVGQVLRLPPV